MKNWLIREDHAGNDLRQEEKGLTEGEMVGWPHQLNGHEFEQAPGGGDGQGSLACCSPWGHSQASLSDWTTANHISYPNLPLRNVRDFPTGCVCSLCSLGLESPHLFPIPSLLMTPYPSFWTISSTTYFCLHSQDLPFTPKPKQSFLLADSSLMVLTTFHRHWGHLGACSSLPLHQNATSLRAVIRNTHEWTHLLNHLSTEQLLFCYRFGNTSEHLSDTEDCFKCGGSEDERD